MGMLSILDWIGLSSEIENDLKQAMPEQNCGMLAARISSIAKFWVSTGGDTLPNMYAWQVKHGISEEDMISEDIYRAVFELLGTNESFIQEYFKNRAERLDASDSIAYDSTTISTYSDNLTQARYGFNKDKDGLPTIKLLTLYSLNTEQPIAYWSELGNLPDSICVENALKQLEYLTVNKPTIVTDNGFCTQENLVRYIQNHIKFVTRITKSDGKWVKESIDQNLSLLDDINNVIDFDNDITGTCITVKPSLSYTAKYSTSSTQKGDKITLTSRLYLGIFRSSN